MPAIPYISGAAQVSAAADLLSKHGRRARDEAAARADRSRSVGNHIRFCEWRQVERLVEVLASTQPVGTVQ